MTAMCISLGIMVVLLFLSMPIGVSIAVATLAGVVASDMPTFFFTQRMFSLFESFPIMAIPFFIIAGDIMQRGTLANSLLDLCKVCVGHKKGGMAHISILTCLFYGALCGSAAATVAAVGATMIPSMVKEGYPKSFAGALNACSGTLGIYIPPSIPLILYGAFGGVSVADLFIATIIPGCIVAFSFMVVAHWKVCKNNYGVIHAREARSIRLQALWKAKWAMGVPVIILGGIYGGIFSPTEAGVVAVFYAIIVELFITKGMTVHSLIRTFAGSLRTVGVIFIIMLAASAMGALMQLCGLDVWLIENMRAFTTNKYLFIAIILGVLFFLGTFMECTCIILMMTTLLVPLAVSYGINPVHFGIWFNIAVNIGLLTPPVGMALFLGASIADVNVVTMSKALLPFVIANIIAVALIAYVPFFSLCLL